VKHDFGDLSAYPLNAGKVPIIIIKKKYKVSVLLLKKKKQLFILILF